MSIHSNDLRLVPGERVLLRGPNTPMLAACWFGVVKAGGSRGEVIISSTPGRGEPPEISGPAIRQAGRLRRDSYGGREQAQFEIEDLAE